MGTHYSDSIRKKVIALGATGSTYREIQSIYLIPKSTLSSWFARSGRNIDKTKQIEHLKKARIASAISKTRQKNERIKDARSKAALELPCIDLTNKGILKSMLAMLYWAEGTKGERSGGPKFVNTDPKLALFYLELLRATYPLDESRLRVRLLIHSYHDPDTAISFWSAALKIPKSQFGKIYVKNRSTRKKFRENFQGICTIEYYDTQIRRELLSLGLLLAEKHHSLSSFNG